MIGDFETEHPAQDYGFHTYGAGRGSSGRAQAGEKGDWCARLAMERGPGGAKMVLPVSLASVESLKVTFRYRVTVGGLGAMTVRFGNGRGRSFVPAKLPNGKDAAVKSELHSTDGWQTFSRTYSVPSECRGVEGRAALTYVIWGKQEPVELLVDDVVAEAVAEEKKVTAPPVKMRFLPHDEPAEPADVGTVPDPFPFDYAVKDGCLTRNGRAHFWFGDGCALSGYSSSPAGLWLARLQGVELVTQNGASGASQFAMTDHGDTIDLWGTSACGYYSWFRENLRFGMLTESPSGAGRWSLHPETEKVRKAHPDDFGDAVYDRGHFMGVDPLAKFGREIMLTKRLAWYDKVKGAGRMIAELNREPGPNPWNQRVRRDFRTWLKRKYGDLETLNRIWRTSFADWETVGPAHLPPKEGQYGRVLENDLRFQAQEKNPARYYDWFLYMIDDCTESNRVETEDLRRHWPGFITCDTRSHPHEQDGYAMYCPDRLEPLWDVFFIHQGWFPVRYATGPYDEPTLLKTSSFPLFCFNYYRTNLEKPIVSTENVVGRVGVPGSNLAAMERNDIAKFHEGTWEFQLAEKPVEGGWRPIRVPGCWDETPEWKSKSGTGWYRRRFTVPGAYGHDFEDGSRRFLLYGQGVAQNGEFWINGQPVGALEGKAWDRQYEFDVGSVLKYGQENEILVKVNGPGYQNGIRKYIHLLANDMITESCAPDARMHRHMLWSFMMGGVSGELNWNWNREDPIRPYLPELLAKMNAVAPFVLPDVRQRKSRVALLHAYVYFRGLPHRPEGVYAEGVKLAAACVFQGVRPSVVSEWKLGRFLEENPVDTLIVPEARIVEDSTVASVKAFLRQGGTVILSGRAMERTFSRYAETDVMSLERQAGEGRVVRIDPTLSLESSMEALAPYLPKPDLPLRNATQTEERPMVERVLAGDAERKVAYFANWGACRQRLALELPEEQADWRLTVLEGNAQRKGTQLAVSVEPQDVTVVLLERPDTATCWHGVPPARAKAMARVVELMEPEKVPLAQDGRKKVLFPDENEDFRDAFTGMKLYPYWVQAFRQRGCRVEAVARNRWTDELLAKYDVVMLPENYKAQWVALGGAKAFGALIEKTLARGGSVCAFANVNGIANNVGLVAGAAVGMLGAVWERKLPIPMDASKATFGDARQITTDEIALSELTEGVRKVALYTGQTFCFPKARHAGKAVVTVTGGRPVMVAAEVGKGRLFVSADAMFGQPLRIEEVDNAALVANIVGWLLRDPATEAHRQTLRRDLFLTQEALAEGVNVKRYLAVGEKDASQ